MFYQLQYHDGLKSEFVSQSPDLPTDEAKNAWYAEAIKDQTLPDGQKWTMVPSDHAWYRPLPTVVQPVAMQEPASDLAAKTLVAEPLTGAGLQPDDELGPTGPAPQRLQQIKGNNPDFNELMQYQQATWTAEREQNLKEQAMLAEYLAKFKKSR